MKTIDYKQLNNFCVQVLQKVGVNEKDAKIVADNLVAADLRGVVSHGVARLARYINGIKDGLIIPNTIPTIKQESAVTAAIDAHDGLGQPAGLFAMNLAIKKAKENGAGIITVKNSNHYGIAGFYAMMALEHGLIGVSLTNTNPLVVPTFGRDMIIGTNPIALAVPAENEYPFVLDMATSTVPRGKIEVYNREEKELPKGWALNANGEVGTNAKQICENMANRAGGGLTPLGGEGELFSGYKGYGLAMLVDIFSGVLSGSAYGTGVGKEKNPNVGHFFMALDIEKFMPLYAFKKRMDDYIQILNKSSKAKGQEKIYIHGEKEFNKEKELMQNGVPLQEKVYEALKGFSQEYSVKFDN